MSLKILLISETVMNKVQRVLNEVYDLRGAGEKVFFGLGRTMLDRNGKYVVNATRLKRWYARFSTAEKTLIKSKFSNVNLKTWIDDNLVDVSELQRQPQP